MKVAPVKLGGNRKQILWLSGLSVLLVLVWIYNNYDSTSTPAPAASTGTSARPAANQPALPQRGMPQHRTPAASRGSSGRMMEDFHPTLKLKEGVDVTTIDPTIKKALLAKVK